MTVETILCAIGALSACISLLAAVNAYRTPQSLIDQIHKVEARHDD